MPKIKIKFSLYYIIYGVFIIYASMDNFQIISTVLDCKIYVYILILKLLNI